MASQYKLIARVTATSQAITGKGGIRFVELVSGSGAASTAALRDEVGSSSTPFLEVNAVAGASQPIYFDQAEGRYPFINGLHVTISGSNAVLYVYGS